MLMIQSQTLLFSTFPQATQMHKLSPYSPGAGTLQYIAIWGTWESIPTSVLGASNDTQGPQASVPALAFWASPST